MTTRILLTSLLFSFVAIDNGKVLLADDPRLDPEVVKSQLNQRRESFRKLEEWVEARRGLVQRQMADVVAGQQDVVAKARKDYLESVESSRVAHYKMREYLEGIYLQDRATLRGQIVLAKNDLEIARDRKLELENQAKAADPDRLIAAELEVEQARLQLEEAGLQLDLLERYTKDKEIKVRQAAIDASEAVEKEKKGLLEAEQAREARLRESAATLRVRSPEDLVIALINDAVEDEGKAVAALAESQKIEAQIRERPAEAASLTAKLVGKKDEATSLMKQAKEKLLEAANLGQKTKARRTELRDAEIKLKKERELLELLEKQLGQ